MNRFIRSVKNALRGIVLGFISERHIRIHSFFTLLVIFLGYYLRVSAVEWMFLFAAMGMVWSTELLNTAIEKLSDRITQSEDQIIRDVKDIAAGAVLFAVFSAIAIGLVIFVPKAVEKLGF